MRFSIEPGIELRQSITHILSYVSSLHHKQVPLKQELNELFNINDNSDII